MVGLPRSLSGGEGPAAAQGARVRRRAGRPRGPGAGAAAGRASDHRVARRLCCATGGRRVPHGGPWSTRLRRCSSCSTPWTPSARPVVHQERSSQESHEPRPRGRLRRRDPRHRTGGRTATRQPTAGDPTTRTTSGAAAKKKRGFSGCFAVILALAVVLGGAYFVGNKGYHYLKDHLSSAEDYPGPGSGQVLFQVQVGRHRLRDRARAQGRGRRGVGPGVHGRLATARPASRSATTS